MLRSIPRPRDRCSALLTMLGAAAVLIAVPGSSRADWNGQQGLKLGDRATSLFVGGSLPEAHAYTFYAPADTKLTIRAAAKRRTSLMPALALFTESGAPVDLGTALNTRRKTAPMIRRFIIPESGVYVLRVSPDSGVGAYTLTTSGLFPRAQRNTFDARTYTFDVRADAKLTAVLSTPRRGTAKNPQFTGLVGPDGAVTIPESSRRLRGINLTTTGSYTLNFAADAAGDVRLVVTVRSQRSRARLANNAGQNRVPMGSFDKGDPNGPAAAGYVGSDSCRQCHPEEFQTVANSFHNSKMRTPFREGAAGYVIPPALDAMFKATGGTDLSGTVGAYDGLQGLRLGYVGSDDLPYKITIGTGPTATTYDVMYVMGGNGPWKQRFVIKYDDCHYITPVQFNEKTQTFSAYHAEHWFDTAGDGSAQPIVPVNSWERRCGACHATGINLTFDEPSGKYLTGYAELNIGCEACHGPGEAHVASANPTHILNPRDLALEGTADGIKKADLTCGQCHNRGSGDTPTGAPKGTGYPWQEGVGIFAPGSADLESYYTLTGAGSFFRHKDNPLGFSPTADLGDDTFVASRQHHQQYPDIVTGPHAPDKVYDGVCFDCHNPHADNSRKHMIADTITRGDHTFTNIENDNNKLCLTCHATYGDFAVVTAADVDLITDTSAPATVELAVREHMTDRASMPVTPGQYAPASATAIGRCSKCHMPKMSKSAVYVDDAAGNPEGDVHSHTFRPVWPNVTVLLDGAITNSCSVCHPTDPGDIVAPIINAWANDGPDADGTFHASTPRNYQAGVANPERDGGIACAACHTTKGFVDIMVNGDIHDLTGEEDADDRTALIHGSLQGDMGITCNACHGRNSDGVFASGRNPLRIPANKLCGTCHNAETVVFEDARDHGEIVRHPQREMLAGIDGGEVSGEFSYANSVHSNFTCTTCHYNTDAGGTHTFEPTVDGCNTSGCHSSNPLTSFDRLADQDYDGDTFVEGIQTELDGALEVLRLAILGAPTSNGETISFVDGHFEIVDGDGEDVLLTMADEALARAMFNHDYVSGDGSRGIHNTKYALQLIQFSYEELTGENWDGATK